MMRKPVVFTLVCLSGLALIGFVSMQMTPSYGGFTAKTSEVRGADITEPDFTTSTTLGFCSDIVRENTDNNSDAEIRAQRIDMVRATIVRAEAWIKLHPGRNPRMQVMENTAPFVSHCEKYECKVIVFLDPVPAAK